MGALFRRGDAWNVFVVDGGLAHLREIQVARLSARVAAVAQGVHPGEIVVVYPPASLAEGSTVKVQ
jgi:HlyD family secretion protein